MGAKGGARPPGSGSGLMAPASAGTLRPLCFGRAACDSLYPIGRGPNGQDRAASGPCLARPGSPPSIPPSRSSAPEFENYVNGGICLKKP